MMCLGWKVYAASVKMFEQTLTQICPMKYEWVYFKTKETDAEREQTRESSQSFHVTVKVCPNQSCIY